MLDAITDVDRLQRINRALMNRVESQLDQQGNSFSLFQTALNLESQVKQRTDELTSAMHRLERTNHELAEAKEAAEVANQSKTSFLAAASHDVLQPLNAALLSVSVLSELQTTQRGTKLVAQVERSLENMNDLLGTLLEISRLDAGVIQPKLDVIHLEVVFENLKADFADLAERKGLKLHFLGGEANIISDQTMLRRILQNLISNGIRYTEAGTLTVSAERIDSDVFVRVIDTGRGISQDLQDSVFEEFNRGSAPAETGDAVVGGFGLGLSIVKKMVASLEHQLTMQSEVHKGTEFSLRIPAALGVSAPTERLSKLPVKKTAQADLQGLQILLLENEPAVIDAMLEILGSWNCQVAVATCTQEAVDCLGDTDWIPDLIIADQHLNHGDLGTVALEQVWAYLGQSIPAIVATADPSEALHETTNAMGLELMVKPLKPAALRSLIMHLISS